VNCDGTCPKCQAEKAFYATARMVEDHAGQVRFVRPRDPTQTEAAARQAREARRAKAQTAKRARKLQRRRQRA
jgi:hypothetical protein